MPAIARQMSNGMGEVEKPEPMLAAIPMTIPKSHSNLGPLEDLSRCACFVVRIRQTKCPLVDRQGRGTSRLSNWHVSQPSLPTRRASPRLGPRQTTDPPVSCDHPAELSWIFGAQARADLVERDDDHAQLRLGHPLCRYASENKDALFEQASPTCHPRGFRGRSRRTGFFVSGWSKRRVLAPRRCYAATRGPTGH